MDADGSCCSRIILNNESITKKHPLVAMLR